MMLRAKLMIKPSRVQYLQIKSQYADAILFYQVGDFYETYDEDAYVAARVLQIVLTKKTYGEERVPMAGVPLHALENYVGKLIQHGYKVAICDQVGEVGKGLVERAVTRILTAGTLSEPNLLPFFFSSRRRHTRLTCDWSSDVCSSD